MPWGDEVMLSDPAVRWSLGMGFTSTAWAAQDGSSFFSGNVPLYPFLLRWWIELFGLNLTTIRAFSYTCFAFAMLLVWGAMIRTSLVKTPLFRIAVCGLLCTAFGMVFMYRNARYDSLAFLLVSFGFFAWSSPKNARKALWLFLAGFLAPWTGIQLLPYGATLFCLLILLQRPAPWGQIVAVSSGMAVGSTSLMLLYLYHGTLKSFIDSILGLGIYFKVANKGFGSKLLALPHAFAGNPFELWQTDRFDPSSAIILLLILGAAGFEFFRYRRFSRTTLFGVFLCLLLPVLFHILAHFRIYYRWMLFVPCTICFFVFLEKYRRDLPQVLFGVVIAAICAASLAGLPLRLLFLASSSKHRDYTAVQMAAATQIQPSDILYTDAIGYFAAVPWAKSVYSEGYLLRMTKEEKSLVTAVALGSDFDSVLKALPGDWYKTFSLRGSSEAFSGAYSLEIYRRVPMPYKN